MKKIYLKPTTEAYALDFDWDLEDFNDFKDTWE